MRDLRIDLAANGVIGLREGFAADAIASNRWKVVVLQQGPSSLVESRGRRGVITTGEVRCWGHVGSTRPLSGRYESVQVGDSDDACAVRARASDVHVEPQAGELPNGNLGRDLLHAQSGEVVHGRGITACRIHAGHRDREAPADPNAWQRDRQEDPGGEDDHQRDAPVAQAMGVAGAFHLNYAPAVIVLFEGRRARRRAAA